jgi:hypothetical protein
MGLIMDENLLSALTVIAKSKDMEGNQARIDWLKARGIRVPNTYSDTVIVIARAALKESRLRS